MLILGLNGCHSWKDTSQRQVKSKCKKYIIGYRILTFQSHLPIMQKIFVDIHLGSIHLCQLVTVKTPLIIFIWTLKQLWKFRSVKYIVMRVYTGVVLVTIVWKYFCSRHYRRLLTNIHSHPTSFKGSGPGTHFS